MGRTALAIRGESADLTARCMPAVPTGPSNIGFPEEEYPLQQAGGKAPAQRRDDGIVAVVLAAGVGKRMHSARHKVLHPVGGRAMVLRVLSSVRDAGVGRAVVVVGNQAEAVQAAIAPAAAELDPLQLQFALQSEQLGTGHAALQGLVAVGGPRWDATTGTALVINGDTPLLRADQIIELLRVHRSSGAIATVLTAVVEDPRGYGRIVRDATGRVVAIVEERDATPEQKTIHEVNTGVGCFERPHVDIALTHCRPVNAQGEIYLTDVVAHLAADGQVVGALSATDAMAVLGVNDRRGLAAAEAALRLRTLEHLMDLGVTIADPGTTLVDDTAVFAPDSVLLPFTIIEGSCEIGSGCTVGPGAQIRDSRLGPGCRVWQSVVEQSVLGGGAQVGPFAHLRPGTRLGENVEVGNFAEIKNSTLGDGSKQHHHSYIGDAEIGERVNVGAGVITVNFDGRRKHRTLVGNDAFLGCNTNLVAPVEVGRGAIIGAGTTVTKTVPTDALAVGRVRPTIKEGWAAARRGDRPE